jgi:hypothetical protein
MNVSYRRCSHCMGPDPKPGLLRLYVIHMRSPKSQEENVREAYRMVRTVSIINAPHPSKHGGLEIPGWSPSYGYDHVFAIAFTELQCAQ